MKYLMVLASGLADEPVEDLGGRTPLEAARTPSLDEMARTGKIAAVSTLPPSLPASEEVALLSATGYDPDLHFHGEAGLACGEWEPRLSADKAAFRFHLVTEADGRICDHAAGHITPRETAALLGSLLERMGGNRVSFHTMRGFTGVAVIPWSCEGYPECLPPDATWGTPIEKCYPRGEGAEVLKEIIALSRAIFAEHEVNRVRTDLGENPANLLWLWGPGRPRELPSFQSARGLSAAMIAATESARGLGALSGMALPRVEGATGGYDTNYTAKALSAVDALAQHDVAMIHVAAPHEASLDGDAKRKVSVIEALDQHVLAPLLRFTQENSFVRLLLMPTHVASVSRRCPLRAPVPAVMCGAGLRPIRQTCYGESAIAQAEVIVERGHEFLEYFLRA